MDSVVAGVRAQARADAEAALRPVAARAEAAERQIARLSTQARQFEQETNNRLTAQARDLTTLRDQTNAAFAEQQRRFTAALTNERVAREKAVAALRADINTLTATRERALDTASEWITNAAILADLIRNTLPHERFTPGRLTVLERGLATAQANATAGLGEAALATAQDTYFQLSDLRAELTARDTEWRFLRDEARKAFLVLAAVIDQKAHQPALDADGTPMPDVDLDVDHWTNGQLTALRAEVTQHLTALETDEPTSQSSTRPLTIDDLRDLGEQTAPTLETRLGALVEQASLAMLSSQYRVNIADIAIDALITNGFDLADHTYAGNDNRQAFYAHLQHPNGDTVVIDVTPDPTTGPAANELRILSYDDLGNDEIRAARARQLAAALRNQGLTVTDPARGGTPPDETLRGGLEPVRLQQPTPEPASAPTAPRQATR
jgi:hypothetical protein